MFKLFSNGCSFLTTRPKDGVNTFTTDILAKHYGLELVNLAMGGRGNDRISFSTKHWFLENQSTDVFAVIGLSSTHRMDYVTSDGWKKGRIPGTELTWRTWKISDEFRFVGKQPGWDIEQHGTMRWLDVVINLQNFFCLHKIPYLFYNSLPIEKDFSKKDFRQMFEKIDKKRYFRIDSSHYDEIKNNKTIVSPQDPHPSTEGHESWAKQIIEFIDANNLRTV
jgi:hypothetical protein